MKTPEISKLEALIYFWLNRKGGYLPHDLVYLPHIFHGTLVDQLSRKKISKYILLDLTVLKVFFSPLTQ